MSFPNYSFSDEIAAPNELGIRREGSFGAIADSLTGMNYYMDTIGFGAPTGLAQLRGGPFANTQRPLGLRFFTKTGLQCSNGAHMHEYISTIPKGDKVGKPIQETLKTMNLPSMKGLVPGILEDVNDSLNPQTLFSAIQSSSYPACRKVRFPVGDSQNQIRSKYSPETIWIKEKVELQNGVPTQERWILDKWVTKDEWEGTQKTEGQKTGAKQLTGNVETMGVSECFQNQNHTKDIFLSQYTGALLLGGLILVASTYFHTRK